MARTKTFQILYGDEDRGHSDRAYKSRHWNAAIRTAGTQQIMIPTYGIIVSTPVICADYCRKVQAKHCQRRADANAINQADKELTTEIRNNVRVDL